MCMNAHHSDHHNNESRLHEYNDRVHKNFDHTNDYFSLLTRELPQADAQVE